MHGSPGGRRRSAERGRSVEFREHRPYTRGDDLRSVDWRAWARTDRLYVRQQDAEADLRVTLLVDASGSMAYGEHSQNKHEYAAVAAVALATLWLRQLDAVGSVRWDAEPASVAPARGLAQATRLVQTLAPAPTRGKIDFDASCRRYAETHGEGGVAVVLSDLLHPTPAIEAGLATLNATGVRVAVLQLMHDDEVDFPLSGATRFVSLESGDTLDANPRSLRRRYLSELAKHQASVAAACDKAGVLRLFTRTSEPVDPTLAELLARLGR